jgi:hypothetical protein
MIVGFLLLAIEIFLSNIIIGKQMEWLMSWLGLVFLIMLIDFWMMLLDVSEAGEDAGGAQFDTVGIKAIVLVRILGTHKTFCGFAWMSILHVQENQR